VFAYYVAGLGGVDVCQELDVVFQEAFQHRQLESRQQGETEIQILEYFNLQLSKRIHFFRWAL